MSEIKLNAEALEEAGAALGFAVAALIRGFQAGMDAYDVMLEETAIREIRKTEEERERSVKTEMRAASITDYIPFGKENAVTRAHLRAATGLPDRKIREEIEQARRRGAIIINAQDGAGYYQSEDIKDIAKQYRQNERRALSILAQQKHLRKRLKEAGVMEGKKVVLNDNV